MSKQKAVKIPVKQTLNLYVKQKTLANPTRLIPILLLIALVAGVIAKYAVIDRLNQVRQAEAELYEMKQYLAEIQSTYTDYDEVEKEYNRYTYQNYDRTLPDRLEVMGLIERTLFPAGSVQNVSINGRTISTSLNGPKLDGTSWLMTSLISEKMVEDVNVSSYVDSTDKGGGNNDNTTITMTIMLVDPTTIVEEEPAEGEAAEDGIIPEGETPDQPEADGAQNGEAQSEPDVTANEGEE